MTAPPADLAVRTEGLTKDYGSARALDGLTISVPVGTIAGFVGPNGAGKTTTIRILLGLIAATSGSAEVLGAPISEPGRYLPRVGAMIEGPAFYNALSGRENLQVLATLGGVPRARIAETLATVELSDRADHPVHTYSMGMRQRLGIAAALLPDPRLLILDEPTNGLDPAGIIEMRTLLEAFAARGLTVLVSSHLLSEIQQIASWLVMIKRGRLLFSGPTEEALGAQRGSFVMAGGDAGATAELATLLRRDNYRVSESGGGAIRVEAPAEAAVELNRRAIAQGIVLSELHYEQPDLEETFFAMTGPDQG